jgi:hypothetical protein
MQNAELVPPPARASPVAIPPMINYRDVAVRIRVLLDRFDDPGEAALYVKVDAGDLRRAVEHQMPHASPAVLAGLVTTFGVDPSWLITGAYDLDGHRRAVHSAAAALTEVSLVLYENR